MHGVRRRPGTASQECVDCVECVGLIRPQLHETKPRPHRRPPYPSSRPVPFTSHRPRCPRCPHCPHCPSPWLIYLCSFPIFDFPCPVSHVPFPMPEFTFLARLRSHSSRFASPPSRRCPHCPCLVCSSAPSIKEARQIGRRATTECTWSPAAATAEHTVGDDPGPYGVRRTTAKLKRSSNAETLDPSRPASARTASQTPSFLQVAFAVTFAVACCFTTAAKTHLLGVFAGAPLTISCGSVFYDVITE